MLKINKKFEESPDKNRGVFTAKASICDETLLFSQKSSIIDARLRSKEVSENWSLGGVNHRECFDA